MPGLGPKPRPYHTGTGVTQLAVVVHKDDLVQQVRRRPVQHAVDGPEQGGERLVEETDHYAG